jgi:hypothetical protein
MSSTIANITAIDRRKYPDMDATAWQAGYDTAKAGRLGLAIGRRVCPYPASSPEC